MSNPLTPEEYLRDGDPREALTILQKQVRARPDDAKLRIFLFQLLCVLGQWERALSQLEVASTLDPAALAMTQTYREAIRCELLRTQVFDGRKSPMVLGQPDAWLALLIESRLREGQGSSAPQRICERRPSIRRRKLQEVSMGNALIGSPTPICVLVRYLSQ